MKIQNKTNKVKWGKTGTRILAGIMILMVVIQTPMSYVGATELNTEVSEQMQEETLPDGNQMQKSRSESIDWTQKTDQLKVGITNAWYQKPDGEIQFLEDTQEGIDFSSVLSEQISGSGFSVSYEYTQTEEQEKILAGDTFQVTIPSEHYKVADTVAPVDVFGGIDTENLFKAGTYEIKDHTLVVTFSKEAEEMALTNFAGEISLTSTLLTDTSDTKTTIPKTTSPDTKDQPIAEATTPTDNTTPLAVTNPTGKGKITTTSLSKDELAAMGYASFQSMKITAISKEGGYGKEDVDKTATFQFNAQLDDDYLLEVLERLEIEDEANYPVYDPGMEQEEYQKSLAAYLTDKAPVEEITFDYAFPIGLKAPTGEDGKSTSGVRMSLMSSTQGETETEVGYYYITDQEDGSATFKGYIHKFIYAKSDVRIGVNFGLELTNDAFNKGDRVEVNVDDKTKLITIDGYVEPGTPDPSEEETYTVTKQAPASVSTPNIEYTIALGQAEGKKELLNGTYLEDAIPKGLQVDSVWITTNTSEKHKLDSSEYTTDNGKLVYRFAKADPDGTNNITNAEVVIQMSLTSDKYKAYVENGTIDEIFKNIAGLKKEGVDKPLALSEEVNTRMNMMFMNKKGTQDKADGTKFNWTVDVNTSFSNLDSAYVADTICWDDHKYVDGTLVIDGKKLSFKERTDLNTPYADLTADLIKSWGETADPFYYKYSDNGNTQAVMIIPFNAYTGKESRITYQTELNLGSMTMEEYIASLNGTGSDAGKTVGNKVKMLWNKLTYSGSGIPPTINPEDLVTISKQVDANVNAVNKEGVSYNAKTQELTWRFKVNYYHADMENVVVTDVLTDAKQEIADMPELKYSKKVTDKKTESGNLTADSTQPVYYTLTRDAAAGTSTISFHLGDVPANTSYDIWMSTKLKDTNILTTQGVKNLAAENKAITTGNIAGTPFTNATDAKQPVVNELLKKKAVGTYNYSTREVKWEVTLNPNFLPITDAVLTDSLPTGNSFGRLTKVTRQTQEGKATEGIIASNQQDVSFSDGSGFTYSSEENGRTTEGYYAKTAFYTAVNGELIRDAYIFTYTTKIDDEAYRNNAFRGGKEVPITNKVGLEGAVYGAPIAADAEADNVAKISGENITKQGIYNKDEGKITWTVVLNKQQIDMGGLELVDELQNDGVTEFNVDSFHLSSAEVQANGLLGKLTPYNKAAWAAAMNLVVVPSKFTMTIPKGINDYNFKTLVLTFDTFIGDNYEESISNKLLLKDKDAVIQDTGLVDSDYTGDFDLAEYATMATRPLLQVAKISSNSTEGKPSGENRIPLEGAKFTLTACKEESTGTYTTQAGKEQTKETRATGNVSFLGIKEDVVYQLEETEAPLGYKKGETQYFMFPKAEGQGTTQTISVDGKTVSLKTFGKNAEGSFTGNSVVMPNTPVDTAVIQFTKMEPDNKTPFSHAAKFVLHRINGETKDQTVTLAEGGNGIVTFKNVDKGNYTITEESAADPYSQGGILKASVSITDDGNYSYTLEKADAKDWKLSLSGTGTGADPYTVANAYVRGSIQVKKVDSKKDTILLSGAEFTLYDKAAYKQDPVKASALQTETTGKDGIAEFKDVPYGNYIIKETKYPTGYQKVTNGTDCIEVLSTEMTVTDKKTYSVKKEVQNERVSGTIKLTKKNNSVAGTLLPNREFTLTYTDKDGYPFTAVTQKTDVNGVLIFSDIHYGNYSLVETIPENDNYKPLSVNITREQTKINGYEIALEEQVKNQLLTTDLKLKKSIGKELFAGETIKGVIFKLSGKNLYGDEIEEREVVTDKDGAVTFSGLQLGNYTLTETRVPGYEVPDPVSYAVKIESVYNKTAKKNEPKITVTSNPAPGTVQSPDTNGVYEITNAPIKGTITLKKTEENEGLSGTENVGVEGAQFGLFAIHTVNGKVTEDTKAAVTGITDDKGELNFKEVEFGTYSLKEIKAPDGYLKTFEDKIITREDLLKGVTGTPDAFSYDVGTITNKPTGFTLDKLDQYGQRVPLEGLLLEIHEGTSDQAPMVWSSKDEKIQGLTQDAWTITHLKTDTTYTLIEKTTPAGYKTAVQIQFQIGKDGKLKDVSGAQKDLLSTHNNYTDRSITMRDARVMRQVELIKTGAGTIPLEGVTFSLYKKVEGQNLLVAENLVTGKNGSWKSIEAAGIENKLTKELISKGLESGDYCFVETSTLDTYYLDTEEVPFTVSCNGFDMTQLNPDLQKVWVRKTNVSYEAEVTLQKEDAVSKELIQGETLFALSKKQTDGTFDKVGVSYQTQKGILTIPITEKGIYQLREIKSATGYVNGGFTCEFEAGDAEHKKVFAINHIIKSGAPQLFNPAVTAGGELLTETGLSNTRIPGTLSLEKVGKMGTEKVPLDGVAFTLYNDVDNNQKLSETDTEVWTKNTADGGKLNAVDLPWGNYVLVETATVPGYKLDNTPHPFTINAGALTYNLLTAAGAVENEQNSFTINKQDLNGAALSGAQFEIWEQGVTSGDAIWVSDADVSVNTWTIVGLLTGGTTYELKEKKAPDGYAVNPKKLIFTMEKDGTLTLVTNPNQAASLDKDKTTITVKNDTIKASIQKVNPEGDKLTGWEFNVTGRFVPIQGVTDQSETTITVDEKHMDALNGLLISGDIYTITETKEPEGYKKLSAAVIVKVLINGTLELVQTPDTEGVAKLMDNDTTVHVINQPTKFSVDKISNETDVNGNSARIAGAMLEIRDSEGNPFDPAVTWNSDGKERGEITNLPKGTYQLVETVTPYGYITANAIEFELEEDNSITITNQEGALTKDDQGNTVITMTDVFVRGDMTLTKQKRLMEDCAEEKLGVPNKYYAVEKEGAEFGLYTDQEATKPVKDIRGHEVKTVPGDGGELFFKEIPVGTYFIKETKAPEGCILDKTVYTAEINTEGEYTGLKTLSGKTVAGNVVVNDVQRTNIVLKKIAEETPGMIIPDAVYGLYKHSGEIPEQRLRNSESWIKIAEATTDQNGGLMFQGVLMDTEYQIREEKAPDGSQLSKYPVTIKYKLNADGTVEVETFDGGGGTATVDPITKELVWKEPSIILGFSKTDTQGKMLSGASLELQDMSGKVLAQWTSTEEQYEIDCNLIKEKVKAGQQYQLVETKAPKGYAIAKPVTFVVIAKSGAPQERFVQQIEMVDEKLKEVIDTKEKPADKIDKIVSFVKTGDKTNVMIYIGSMLLAAMGIMIVLILRKKKQKGE